MGAIGKTADVVWGRRMRNLCFASLFMAVAAASGPAAAKLKDYRITPASTESVIVMRADPQPFDHMLVFSREGQSSFGGRYPLRVRSYESAPFVARAVPPGTYKLNNLVQQLSWTTCFGNGTVAFTVLPGKVYYLGTLNIIPLLEDLQQSAVARGNSRLRLSDNFVEWAPKVKPEFVAGADAEIAAVRAFVTAAMPLTTAPVEALSMVPATFGSSAGKKILQVCG
jgi:hypothetical protein